MMAYRLVLRYYSFHFPPTGKKSRVFGVLEIWMNMTDQPTRESVIEIYFQVIQDVS